MLVHGRFSTFCDIKRFAKNHSLSCDFIFHQNLEISNFQNHSNGWNRFIWMFNFSNHFETKILCVFYGKWDIFIFLCVLQKIIFWLRRILYNNKLKTEKQVFQIVLVEEETYYKKYNENHTNIWCTKITILTKHERPYIGST